MGIRTGKSVKRHRYSVCYGLDWGNKRNVGEGTVSPLPSCVPTVTLPYGVHLPCGVMGRGDPAQPLLEHHLPGCLPQVFCGHWYILIWSRKRQSLGGLPAALKRISEGQNSGVTTVSVHSVIMPVKPSPLVHIGPFQKGRVSPPWKEVGALACPNGLWRWS